MPTALFKFKIQNAKFKVIIASLFLLLTFNFLLATPAFAQNLPNPAANNWNAIFQVNFTGNGLLNMFSCWLSGFGLGRQGCVVDQANSDGPSSPKISYNGEGGGALGSVAMVMGSLYSPPADTGYFLANLGKNFGISSAYAQQQNNILGSGQGIIDPVFKLWQVTRNFTYVIFILIIIAVGFMIMLRQRINPQTVVTVQLAIPQIVISLIVITFSYFIAALVIDLAFLGVTLVAQLFNPANVGPNVFGDNVGQLQNIANNGNALSLFTISGLNGKAIRAVAGGSFQQFTTTLGVTPSLLGIGTIIAGFLTVNLPLILGGAAAAASPILVPALLVVILLIALFIQMFRLVFALLMSYIQLLVLTVTGPLLIMVGAIPGRNGNINFWFRGLLANTLVFPAVFATFLFAGLILGSTNGIVTTLPLFGGVSGDFLKVLIAYGILLGSPAIPDMIRQAFKWQGPGAIVNAASGGFLAGAGAATAFRPAGQRALGGFLERRFRGPANNAALPEWAQERFSTFRDQAGEMARPRR